MLIPDMGPIKKQCRVTDGNGDESTSVGCRMVA